MFVTSDSAGLAAEVADPGLAKLVETAFVKRELVDTEVEGYETDWDVRPDVWLDARAPEDGDNNTSSLCTQSDSKKEMTYRNTFSM